MAGHLYSGIVKNAINKGSNVNAAQAVSLALEATVQGIGGGGGEAWAQWNVHDELTERYGLSEWRWGDIALEAVSEVAIAIPAAVINRVTSCSPLKAEMMLLNRQIKAIKANPETKRNYVINLLKPHQNYEELDSYRSRREEINITPEVETPLLEAKFEEFSGLPEKRITSEEAVEQASKIPLFLRIVREGKLEQVKEIFTPEGNMAWGSYRDTIIQFVENPQETTLPHETFHAFIDLFAEEKRKQAAFNAVRLRAGNQDLSDSEVEEILSDEFASWFIEDSKPKGLIERFFAYVKRMMKTFAKDGKVNKLFEDAVNPHFGEMSIAASLSPDVVTKYQGRKDVPETEKQKKLNKDKRNFNTS